MARGRKLLTCLKSCIYRLDQAYHRTHGEHVTGRGHTDKLLDACARKCRLVTKRRKG